MPGTKKRLEQETKRIGRFLTTTVKEDPPCKLESATPPISNSKLITALVKTDSIELGQEVLEDTVLELDPSHSLESKDKQRHAGQSKVTDLMNSAPPKFANHNFGLTEEDLIRKTTEMIANKTGTVCNVSHFKEEEDDKIFLRLCQQERAQNEQLQDPITDATNHMSC